MSSNAKHFDIIIVGTGFGGISTAIELLKNNITNFVMLERRSFAGGTWLQNTYPGAAVDVQSPLYSLSGHPYPWSHLFAKQDEIAEYTQLILKKYALHEHILLNHEVNQSHWTGDSWYVALTNSNNLTCKVLINATGPLSTPVIPDFKDKAKFEGEMFHSNDWDHSVDIHKKDVVVIGSGASSAQIVPAIIDDIKQLYLIQRTPHWILPRTDWHFKPWLKKLVATKPVNTCFRWIIYWLLELRVIAFKYSPWLLNLLGTRPALKFLKRQVSNDKFRERLTPNFKIGCKRILVSNTYYPAIQRDNCELIDGDLYITHFTKQGIALSDGTERKVDVVVFATGFNAAESMVSYPVFGRHNMSLSDYWQRYPRAYLGTSMPNFPNFFVVTGPNTGIGHTSAIFAIESQLKYIMQCVSRLIRDDNVSIEPTEFAQDKYTNKVHQEMKKTVWSNGGCKSWYQNKEGKVIAMYPGFSFVYRRLCKRFVLSDHILEKTKK